MQDKFSAHTKYNDYRGTVAADIHDNYSLTSLLQEKKLLADNERIVGVNAGSGNPTPGDVKTISVCAYIAPGNTADAELKAAMNNGDSAALRMVEIQMTPAKFFSLFKRFDLVMSRDGVLNGLPLHYYTDEEV